MKPELVAAIEADKRELSDRLSRPVDDPAEAADRLVKWLQDRGWRRHLELADKPSPARFSTKEGRAAARRLFEETRRQGGAA